MIHTQNKNSHESFTYSSYYLASVFS